MKCYLLDLENLPYAVRWASKRVYDKNDRIYVLYSDELYGFYIQNKLSLEKRCRNIHGVRIFSRKKNALDFNLAGIFGMLIQECIQSGKQDLEVHIVSEDRGYIALVNLASWARLNFGVRVNIVFDNSKEDIVRSVVGDRITYSKEESLLEKNGFKFYRYNKNVLNKYVLGGETKEVKDKVKRALVGAKYERKYVYESLQKFFSEKEASSLYKKLKSFLEENTVESVNEYLV